MKRLLFLSFLMVSASAQTLASTRIIEKPEFLYQNSFGLLHIDSVTTCLSCGIETSYSSVAKPAFAI